MRNILFLIVITIVSIIPLSYALNYTDLSYSSSNATSKDLINNIQNLSKNSNPSISQMHENDLKNLLEEKTTEIITTLWQTTEITEVSAVAHTVLGFILGFGGTMIIESYKELRSKQKINSLIKTDILRIHRNVHQNLQECIKLSVDHSSQHEFLNNIQTIPDLENLQYLGASQEFNFWQTILSSTQLILLNKEQIKNSQFVYDMSRKYNASIESIINGKFDPASATFVTVSGKQALAENILVHRNMHNAHLILQNLCMGLISIHEEFLKFTKTALLSFKVKENEIP